MDITQESLDHIIVEGINTNDYPDFCDAFIASAEHEGRLLTDDELDELNKDSDFVYNCVQKQIFY